jgi:hypothetical protein
MTSTNNINALQNYNTTNCYIDTSIPEEIFIEIINHIIPNLEKVSPLTCVSKRWNVTILTHVKDQLQKLSFTLCAFSRKERLFNPQGVDYVNEYVLHNKKETIPSAQSKISYIIKSFLNNTLILTTYKQENQLFEGFEYELEDGTKQKKWLSLKNQSIIPRNKLLSEININKEIYKEICIINSDEDLDSKRTRIFYLIKKLINNNLVNELFVYLKKIHKPPINDCIEVLTCNLLHKFGMDATVDFVTKNLDVEEELLLAFTWILDVLLVEDGDLLKFAQKMNNCRSGTYYIKQIAKACALRGYSPLATEIALLIPSQSERMDYLGRLSAKQQVYEVGKLISDQRPIEACEHAKGILHIRERDRALCAVFEALLMEGLYDKALSTINALSVAADSSASETQSDFLEEVIALLFADEILPEEFSNFLSWSSEKKQILFAHVNPSILLPFIKRSIKESCRQERDDEAFDLAALVSNTLERQELYSFIMKDIQEDRDPEIIKGYIVDTIFVPLFERGSADQADEMLSVLSPEDQESYWTEIQNRLH